MNKESYLVTITFPKPISKIVSPRNMIVTNEGEYYSPYECWYDTWSEGVLKRYTKAQLYQELNAEFCGELESGFVFKNKKDAMAFITAMQCVTK